MRGIVGSGTQMRSRTWTFDLEDGPHTVKLSYSPLSSREIVELDGITLSDEYSRTLRSNYNFVIGENVLRATFRVTGFGAIICGLTVNGLKPQDLGSRSLLKPAARPQAEALLRPTAHSRKSSGTLVRAVIEKDESK